MDSSQDEAVVFTVICSEGYLIVDDN